MIHKYKDWSGWWDGLRSKSMRAGAEAITTNLGGLLTTNGLAATVPGLSDIGMSWKTAIATTLIQFSVRIVLAAAKYVQDKPDPDVIEETIETGFLKKE